jgi:hypothetical protein
MQLFARDQQGRVVTATQNTNLGGSTQYFTEWQPVGDDGAADPDASAGP